MNYSLPIIILFLLLSILFAIEASTSLARVAGINTNNLASGLQLQSGLSIFSRLLMSIFMPFLGALADSNHFTVSNLSIVFISTALIPASILCTYALRKNIMGFYQHTTINIIKRGSYFPIGILNNFEFLTVDHRVIKKLGTFRMVTLLSYIPYYIAWPVIILLLTYFPNDRGFIIGISSIMNGINSLALILYIDPILIKLSKNKNVSRNIYYDQLKIRFVSALFASIPFFIALIFI